MAKSPLVRLFLLSLLLALPAARAAQAQETENRPGPPSISSFSPVRGGPGTLVTVLGQNLAGVRNVFFGAQGATFQEMPGGTLLRTTVPAGATTGPLRVTTTGGAATSSQVFLVTGGDGGGGSPLPPRFFSIAPNRGPVGTVVTITGEGLSSVRNVFFGSVPAPFQEFPGGLELQTTVPIGAVTAPITVTTVVGSYTHPNSFTVETGGGGGGGGAPTISFFDPGSGPVLTQIQIAGSGFLGTTDVRINNVPLSASYFVVSDNEIQATVQPIATTGRVSVITTHGTATSTGTYTVQTSPQQPSISSFSPTSGGLGTLVILYGQNLSNVQNVFFNGQVAAFQEMGGSQLRTWVPPGASTGPIKVVTAAGVATSAQAFFVVP